MPKEQPTLKIKVHGIEEIKPEIQKNTQATEKMVEFLSSMKGDKGEQGEQGEQGIQGEKGEQGERGERGEQGIQGENGIDGINGRDGRDGIDGKDGKDGKKGPKGDDGSPDTPKQIKDKLESLEGTKRLDISAIKGVEKLQKQIDHISTFGSNAQTYKVSGAVVSSNAHSLNIKAGSNITLSGTTTADGADITINAIGDGTGTVTSVATDSTLTGGPITTTGTLGLNLSNSNTWAVTQTFTDIVTQVIDSHITTQTFYDDFDILRFGDPLFAQKRIMWSNGNTGNNWLAFLDEASGPLNIYANYYGDGSNITGINHNTLANLTTGDVHTQYALLAGRSGGQTLIGGTASGNNLTLQSTSNVTRGKILFGTSAYDEVNDRLYLGTTSPTGIGKLQIYQSVTNSGEEQFRITDGATGGYFSISEGATGAALYVPIFRFASAGINGLGGGFVGTIPAAFDAVSAGSAAILFDGRRETNASLTSANVLCVRNYTTSLMTITAGGLVKIGTGQPVTALDVTGQVSASLGSVGAPTYSFIGDTNTGIYSSGADSIQIVTGGTARFFIGSNGQTSFINTINGSAWGSIQLVGTGTSVTDGQSPTLVIKHNTNDSATKSAGIITETRMTSRYLRTWQNIGNNDNSFGNAGVINWTAWEYTDVNLAVLTSAGTPPTEFKGWNYQWWNGSAYAQLLKVSISGVGIGMAAIGTVPSAKLHVIGTTEQLRLGYDTSNYFTTTIGTTGGVTFDAVGAGAGFTFSDSITLADAKDFIFNTTTGTKIGTATSQKIGIWNATPIVQPTTGVASSTLVSNGGTTLTDTDTFDGYTLKQIVKALRNIGLLA